VVLPSLDEGFGIPALEAMTVGVPLVVARRGALPDLVGDAALLVDPLDVDELSKAMQAVVTDTELQERLSQAGPKRALNFTWRASANVLHEAYLFAIEHRRR
jgi:glycosyltransferase involved in cell wall biosynthesis